MAVERQLLLHNLKESYGPEASRVVADMNSVQQMLYALGATNAAENIESIVRVGEYNLGKNPRSIVITFVFAANRQVVLQNAHQVHHFPEWNNILFTDVLPLQEQHDIDPEKVALRLRIKELEKMMLNGHIEASTATSTAVLPDRIGNQGTGFTAQLHNHVSDTSKQFAFPSETLSQQRNLSLSTSSCGIQNPPFSIQPTLNDFNGIDSSSLHSNDPLLSVAPPTQLPEPNQQTNTENLIPTSEIKTAVGDNIFYKSQAEKHLVTKRTLNILVLGESGVGKSTWINGIANYMSFNTLQDALAAPRPICLIASKFTFYETHEDRIEVKLEPSHGEKDENESFSKGQSSTQEPKTYQFETSKYIVNIIDTPGIGDTRGIEQDKENTRKILAAIGQYKDLHAICFLFKANEARMTLSFRYCISELLLQLHKDAVDNICFFFTNARGTCFKPGDTMTPLEVFLSELEKDRGLRISLTAENICCGDNEAFRLVCAAFNGAKVTQRDFDNFAGSWQKSAEETHRFIEFAARLRPHNVADTISVNKARTVILLLAKPLADVNELIESNIKVFNDRESDLKNTATNMDELKKKVKISQIGIEVIPLEYPKTVCTSERCIETSRLPNTEQFQTIYKQICHDHCYLTGVDVEKVPEPSLKGCTAMGGQLNCQQCECPWDTHMHIRFDQVKTTLEIENKNTKEMIEKNKSASSVKKQMLKDCEQKVIALKAEQKEIINTSLRFGSFLQANAILPYSDAFEKYVEKSISEEEKCIKVGGDPAKLKNLKKLLAEYKQEKTLITKAAKKSSANDSKAITPAEIDALKVKLFGLPHTGKTLKALFEASEDGISKNNAHVTVKYSPTINPSQIINNFTKNIRNSLLRF